MGDIKYAGSKGGAKCYYIGKQKVCFDEEDGIHRVTAESILRALAQNPELLSDHALKSKPFGPVNGRYYYFPTKGGGLLSKGRKFIKPTG